MTSSSTPLFAKSRHIPEMIPENDAYDIARNSGAFEADIYVDIDDSDDAREGLGSMRGVRSSCSVDADVGVAAAVRIVGSPFGCKSGDSGGVSAGNAMRLEDEYSTACV